jgi:hypothetical protein
MKDETQSREFRIGDATIILRDIEPGKGEIIVLRGGVSWTSFWGAMGSNLEEFLQRINSEYFAGNLTSLRFSFNSKKTVTALRKAIKETLPWYDYMDAQKELRVELKSLETCPTEDEFVRRVFQVNRNIWLNDLNGIDQRDFRERLDEAITTEPWHHIQNDYHREYLWLQSLHGKIKGHLEKTKPEKQLRVDEEAEKLQTL